MILFSVQTYQLSTKHTLHSQDSFSPLYILINRDVCSQMNIKPSSIPQFLRYIRIKTWQVSRIFDLNSNL